MTPSLESRARRHYLGANVASTPDGFCIELDGRAARAPGGHRLVLPTESLARVVADEWNAQKDFIDVETMPATRLAKAAIDVLPAARVDLARRVTDYAGDDLLCYFADAPAELVRRQQAVWGPILAWAEGDLGLVFCRASGISHVDQPSATSAGVEAAALALTDFQLVGLAAAAQIFGSAVLALALMKRRVTPGEAFAASRIDETFQAETWGEDAEAALRGQAMAREAEMLGRWFTALR